MISFLYRSFIIGLIITVCSCKGETKPTEKEELISRKNITPSEELDVVLDSINNDPIQGESSKYVNTSEVKQIENEVAEYNSVKQHHKEPLSRDEVDIVEHVIKVENRSGEEKSEQIMLEKIVETMPQEREKKAQVDSNRNHAQNINEEFVKEFKPNEIVENVSAQSATDVSKVSHELWNNLLTKYVDDKGHVNYKGFNTDYTLLNTYLELLKNNSPKDKWSRSEKMAYWINAYNAFTVDLIVTNYPISSITALDDGNPWKVKRILIGGKSYSLNDIEHVILRPQFKDARIHFAVNCAAKSCPKLHNQAFTADNLEANLEKLTKEFINSDANKISDSKVELSKIFEWYKEDFTDLMGFLNNYTSSSLHDNTKVSFLEYNWSLNE